MSDRSGAIDGNSGDAGHLRRRLERLEEQLQRTRFAAAKSSSDLEPLRRRPPLEGHATPQGCRRLRDRFEGLHAAFYRSAGKLLISRLGIGTSRGAADAETDSAYVRAIGAALAGGINLIDTAINYRFQRSEVAVGSALREHCAKAGENRDEAIVCSKGGFVVPGAFSPQSIPGDEAEAGFHSISAAFLADQLERSRRNLGLETIDIYYVHNPEVHLPFVGETEVLRRLTRAFEQLERSVSEGKIGSYGVATWNCFRPGGVPLTRLIEAARRVAGDDHHFRFVQLPLNRHDREAATSAHERGRTVLEVAAEAGVTVFASAALGGPRHESSVAADDRRPSEEALDSLQDVASTPGISSALVGMRRLDHVRANLAIARLFPGSSFGTTIPCPSAPSESASPAR